MSEEHTETRSVNERIVLIEIASEVIKEYPLFGVGAGNFPWFASHYIYYETDYEMRGQDVHLVLLLIQAEYGIVGVWLTLTTLALGFVLALRKFPNDTNSIHRYALLSGVVALVVVGLVDHYPWTSFHIQILWWGGLATAATGHQAASASEISNGNKSTFNSIV
jgi:O-antigen ligase